MAAGTPEEALPAEVLGVREAVREGGLFARDRPLLAMISGGRDSTCLLDVAVALLGAQSVYALHLNYGLRPEAQAEEERCRELCAELGVELEVVRPDAAESERPGDGEGMGNLQAWARELRYAAAERLAGQRDALIATGHTASDQVETILYRLAASPGRRALLGMAPAEGRLLRPLLGVTREQTGAYCAARGLRWADDASNQDPRFARARVRHGLVPALRAVHPAAEANVARTAELLREETELLDALVEAELGSPPPRDAIELARLKEMPAALARMVVVRLAEQATGGYVPQAGARVAELLELGRRGGRAELHVGGSAGAVIEEGMLRMVRLPPRGRPDERTAAGPPPDRD
ncbi:MAG TPA: tRNA lysidine(34) synthetase TilS [Solirubrobacteraceae bacterium]|jgi:tRNA(Ile)-lysidine synthase|nr:tRNA lysidine(34) synthetase TilS [Solirubrobacteraceae bacterium]